ncbi:MAG: NADH-quinone oxidoreductase subunit C [Firmicutes bacterium]|nr:NADH-quinone oxidoreductase subunit C [Bacillota bacterium]
MTQTDTQPQEKQFPVLEGAENITIDNLTARVKKLDEEGYRLLTATCLDRGEKYEIYYHFDKDLTMLHLRLLVNKEEEVPSLSLIYLCAFLIENEMKELFGVKFSGLFVNYGGRLFLGEDSDITPMLKCVDC